MCSLGLGAIGEPAVAHTIEPAFEAMGVPDALLHPVAFVIALAIVVYLHVVVGEMVPKNLAIAGPERSAMILGPPMAAIVVLLKPLVVGLNMIANGVLRLLRVTPREEVATAFTREEVAGMVDESRGEGLLDERSYDLVEKTIGFTQRDVTSVLLSIETLATIPRDALMAEVERRCVETGFSRFPVTGTSGDLIGFVHIKDVLDTYPDRLEHANVSKWVRPMATIRSSSVLQDALISLQRKGTHLGRVVDDEGTDLGVIALEDVIEELVGEIRDSAQDQAVR
jgi:CBS domain containing-hemolysin-like protein